MSRLTYALLSVLSLVSTSAHAYPQGECTVGVRLNDKEGQDPLKLTMNTRGEDAHGYEGVIEGIKLRLTFIEKDFGYLDISATEVASGKALTTPVLLSFEQTAEIRRTVDRDGGKVLLDITCHYSR